MVTKFEEIIETTSELSEMQNKFLAERLCRIWKEDFVDEDTSEVVSIERKEIILEKGAFLDSHNLSEINFYLQSGEVKEVKVSNQERACVRGYSSTTLWIVSVVLNSKKKNIYLYSNSVENAIKIATDYIEQKYSGSFDFKSLKELDYSNLLSEDQSIDSYGDEINVYKIEIEVLEDGESYETSFIVHGTDAENCKTIINNFIVSNRVSNNKSVDFEIKILSAKTIPCNYIVDPSFCKVHLENNI